MALATVASFLILAAALQLHARPSFQGRGRIPVVAMVVLVTVFGLLVAVGSLDGIDLAPDASLAIGAGTLGRIPLGRMSPVTGAVFSGTGLGTLMLLWPWPSPRGARRAGHVASSLGFLAVLVAFTVLLAYLYGAPLMYGGTTVPMALTTAIAFILLGAALSAAAGPLSLPLRLVVGNSSAARLSRAFVPISAAVVLLLSALHRLESTTWAISSPLFVAGFIVAMAIVTLVTVARVSHSIGAALDQQALDLVDSAARMRAITESASDAVITGDDAGQIVDWNRGAGIIFGYTHAEAVGMSIARLMPDYHRAGHSAGLHRVASGGDSRVIGTTVEVTGLRKDGTTFPLELSLARWAHHDEQFFTGIIRDITERQAAAHEQAALRERLAHLQKMESIGLLAGGVAHEFNNQLAAILGYAELTLHKLGVEHTAVREVEAIRTAAQRSADLAGHLLAFARRQASAPRPLDLNDAVVGILDALAEMRADHVAIAWLPGAALWTIEADSAQLDQVLTSLVANAVDAMTEREARLEIATQNVTLDAAFAASHTGAHPGEYVQLRVSDNGCGMNASTRARLFEPFFTTKPPGKGTGLALAAIHGIMAQHGGFIDVESAEGVGTAVRCYFPRSAGPAS